MKQLLIPAAFEFNARVANLDVSVRDGQVFVGGHPVKSPEVDALITSLRLARDVAFGAAAHSRPVAVSMDSKESP